MSSSQVSKCSEASVIEAERTKTNFDKLIDTVESISSERINIKKPLKKKSTKRAINDVAKIIHVVVKTVQPSGSNSDNLKLANDAVDRMKLTEGDTIMDDTLVSLIEHFQNVTNHEIKRSLLGEISKKLSLQKIKKLVNSKITAYE